MDFIPYLAVINVVSARESLNTPTQMSSYLVFHSIPEIHRLCTGAGMKRMMKPPPFRRWSNARRILDIKKNRGLLLTVAQGPLSIHKMRRHSICTQGSKQPTKSSTFDMEDRFEICGEMEWRYIFCMDGGS
jgi:hypothetical protein